MTTPAQRAAERPFVNNQGIFDELWTITTELKDKVFKRFAFQPDPCSDQFQPYGGEHTLSGFLSTFAGPEINWLVYSWGTPHASFTFMNWCACYGAATAHCPGQNSGFVEPNATLIKI